MKRPRIYIAICLFFLVNFPGHGQQLPIFSQYVLNGFILNPAMAGYDGYTSVNTTGRQQWVTFEGAPLTVSASFQTRLLQRSYRIVNHPVRDQNMLVPSTKGRVGLGAYVINDRAGNVSRTGMQFTYAYHIIFNNHQLSFGLAGKMFQYRIDRDNLEFGQGNTDPLKGTGMNVGYTPDADFGIYFTNMDYFIGASANNLFQSVVNIGGEGGAQYKILRHYWVVGGYKFPVSSKVELEPNFLLKTTEQWVPQADMGMKLYYIEDYWTGLAFRTDGTFIAMLGMHYEGVYVGYSFDYSLSSIQSFNLGTHELTISVKLGNNARRYRWLRRY